MDGADGRPALVLAAGEASGDVLGGLLLQGLRQRWPALRAAGIGGPHMQAQGFEAWWPQEKLAVSGYVEVLRRYREIVGIRRQLRQRVFGARPDAFIGVDAPDFNLELEQRLRAAGIRTIHFVCPSIWAWRPGRVEKLRRAADRVLCLFPFEPPLLERQGVAATYVGHPLADVIPMEPDRAAARAALGEPDEATVIALLPGSRESEVQQHASLFIESAALLARQIPGVRFLLPASPGRRAAIDEAMRAAGMPAQVRVLDGQSHAALAACDVALVASGTATLEAALFKRPMVVAYRLHPLTWRLMRRQALLPWIGLPNILCNEGVVPELLQERATPQALSQALLDWLGDAARIRAIRDRFTVLHGTLKRDTATLATHAIAEVLQS